MGLKLSKHLHTFNEIIKFEFYLKLQKKLFYLRLYIAALKGTHSHHNTRASRLTISFLKIYCRLVKFFRGFPNFHNVGFRFLKQQNQNPKNSKLTSLTITKNSQETFLKISRIIDLDRNQIWTKQLNSKF